jgi:hypothetical protein
MIVVERVAPSLSAVCLRHSSMSMEKPGSCFPFTVIELGHGPHRVQTSNGHGTGGSSWINVFAAIPVEP